MNYFSFNLKFLRKRSGKTQIQITQRLGLSSSSTYSQYESGKSKPEFDTLIKLKELYNVNLDDLIFKKIDESFGITASEPAVEYGIDYKSKYLETLEKLNAANERLLSFTDLKKEIINTKQREIKPNAEPKPEKPRQ